MNTSKELNALLKQSSPEIQHYVAALQAENLRLVKYAAKVEAQLTTANSMIDAYKQGETPNPAHYMTDAELMEVAKGDKDK